MKLSSQQYAQALYSAIKNSAPAEQAQRISNFLKLLKQQRKLKLLPKIIEQFTRQHYAQQNIIPVTATVAQEIDPDQLSKELAQSLNQPVALTVKIKPEILGGLKVQIADQLIDGSVQQKLSKLREQIIK